MTSRLVAAAREAESKRPDRLFDDPYAGALARDEGRAMLKMVYELGTRALASDEGRAMLNMHALGGMPSEADRTPEDPYLVFRTRFFDDTLLETASQGLRQIVILAAGMDTRALRLKWPQGTTVFEVDRPEVLQYKEAILSEFGVKPQVRRVTIALDLREDYVAALRSAGYASDERAVFLVEGLLPYFSDEDAVCGLFSTIASAVGPGSCIAFDTLSASFLTSGSAKPFVDALTAKDIVWKFGTDWPEALLQRCGFSDPRVVEPAQLPYRSWPFAHVPRSTPGIPRWFLVTANKVH